MYRKSFRQICTQIDSHQNDLKRLIPVVFFGGGQVEMLIPFGTQGLPLDISTLSANEDDHWIGLLPDIHHGDENCRIHSS